MRDFIPQTRSEESEKTPHVKTILPNEIYRIIVGHVANIDYVSKQNALISLSRSSEPLISLAEEYLYMHPRDLDTTEKQRQFLVDIRTKTVRSGFVESLRLLWDSDGSNSSLLVDIINACFNVKSVLIQRGNDLNDATRVSSDCVATLGTILGASLSVTSFHFCTTLEWVPEPEQDELVTKFGKELSDFISATPQAMKCLRQLDSLTLGGQSDWVIDGILPYLGSNLTSLFLSQDCSMGSSETPFADLSRQCPYLRSLEFRQTLATSDDLEQACKAWGESLEELKIFSIEDTRDWISQVMPFMKVLKLLHIGAGCTIPTSSIRSIASAESPLEEISLEDIMAEDEHWEVASDEMNQAIVRMIDVHASKLKVVYLHYVALSRDVMQSCKKVKQLREVYLSISYAPESLDIDEYLDMCPELILFPRWFKECSARQGEWEERIKMRNNIEEGLRQGIPHYSLGS